VRAPRSPIAALAFALLLNAQSELPEDVLQLARLKRDVEESLTALPNYTCVETIERSQRKNSREPFRRLDTLHVEVAIVDRQELYSWPGANEFEDRDLGEMVGAGMVSTGSFAAAIANALGNDISTIRWHGYEEIRGRRAARWDYTIPYNLSRWTIQVEDRGGRVSERGSFWADAQTLALLRLEVAAEDIPPDLPVQSLKTSIDYARTRVGSRDELLPQSAAELLTKFDGSESLNRMEFSQCREFVVESTFMAGASVAPEKAPSRLIEFQLPPGLHLSIRLSHAVDSTTAAVGDLLTATISTPVKYHEDVLIPKGALVEGRIRLLERQPAPRPHYLVGVEFTDVAFAGRHARFIGETLGIQPIAGLSLVSSTSKTYRRDLAGFSNATTTETETEVPIPVPGVSTFFMEGASFQLPKGFEMSWRSVRLER
jgi:hypothetical protein